VLVERYLALLDSNPDWPLNALVAITFTRKAAGEMRDRVRTELEKRRQAAEDAEIRRRWSDVLAAMDTARIDTIHGLCATILRANAAEAGVDPDFAVLEETDAHILLEDVIDDVLRALVVEHDAAIALFTEYERATVHATLSTDLLNADRARFRRHL
jgi:ATP-dependent helicase/nuclease subunit A